MVRKRKILKVCDRDCFNCPFDDCIKDDITSEEIQSIEKRNGTNQDIEKRHSYYLANREKIIARSRKYYQEHKQERIAYAIAHDTPEKAHQRYLKRREKKHRESQAD